jgi:RibD C-terminal domain
LSSAGRSPTIRRKRHGLSVPLSAQSCTSWAGSGTLKTTDWANSTILSGDTTEEIEKLRREGTGEILAHGGVSFARSLVRLDLVDEYRLNVFPYLAGSGRSLFADVACRGCEEEHPGRFGSWVEEGVRAAGGNEHEPSRPAPEHRGAGRRLPGAPVAAGLGSRLEGEQVEFAFQHVEQLFGLLMQMPPDVESGCDLGLERRLHLRLFGARLQGHGLDLAAATGW